MGVVRPVQPLSRYAFSYSILLHDDLINREAIEQALQNGPVVLGGASHYTVLSDYKEFYEDGQWVPYALMSDPAPARNYTTGTHMSWWRLSDGWLAANAFALADIRSRSTGLNAKIHRVSWDSSTQTTKAYVNASGANRYEWRVYDSGGPSGNGSLWNSGTVYAPALGDAENCWDSSYTTATSEVSFPIGGMAVVRPAGTGLFGKRYLWRLDRSPLGKPKTHRPHRLHQPTTITRVASRSALRHLRLRAKQSSATA